MLQEDTRPWPRPCHRCGKWLKQEQAYFGHGWTMFCDSCENSYNKWYESGMTDERRKQIENNEKAFEILIEWVRDEKYRGFRCIKCNKKGNYDAFNTCVCKDHYQEFEKLKKDLNYIEG